MYVQNEYEIRAYRYMAKANIIKMQDETAMHPDFFSGGIAVSILAAIPDLVCVCRGSEILWVNDVGVQVLEADCVDAVIGQSFMQFLSPDYAMLGDDFFVLLAEERRPVQVKVIGVKGASHDCELTLLPTDDGAFGGTDVHVVHARNITDINRVAETLHRNELHLRELINNSMSMICECRDGLVYFTNAAGVNMIGAQGPEQLVGKPIHELFHADYVEILGTGLSTLLEEKTFVPLRLLCLDGTYKNVEMAVTPLVNMGDNSFLAEVRDITRHNEAVGALRDSIENLENRVVERTASLQREITVRREAEDKLLHLAYHDGLTGLANRGLLMQHLEKEMTSVRRHGNRLALMFLDLDGFKAVNDTLGHDAGDDVLIWVARILQECTRATDTVARLGGDEFALVITDVDDHGAVSKVADKILERVGEKVQIQGAKVDIGVSIGISLFPSEVDACDADALLRTADHAMYAVKKKGKNNYMFFPPEA